MVWTKRDAFINTPLSIWCVLSKSERSAQTKTRGRTHTDKILFSLSSETQLSLGGRQQPFVLVGGVGTYSDARRRQVTKTSKQLKDLVRDEGSEEERLDSRNDMTKCNVQLKRITETAIRKNNWVRSVEEERSITLERACCSFTIREVHSAVGWSFIHKVTCI